jgi:hypothetical protein
MSNAIEYVWVANAFGGVPAVQRYELVRRTATQIVVRRRSADEHHIRPAIGTHWFFDEPAMKAFVKATCEKAISDAEARIRKARQRIDDPYVEIIPYTPGPQPPIRL